MRVKHQQLNINFDQVNCSCLLVFLEFQFIIQKKYQAFHSSIDIFLPLSHFFYNFLDLFFSGFLFLIKILATAYSERSPPGSQWRRLGRDRVLKSSKNARGSMGDFTVCNQFTIYLVAGGTPPSPHPPSVDCP